jgi:hypothetical protein
MGVMEWGVVLFLVVMADLVVGRLKDGLGGGALGGRVLSVRRDFGTRAVNVYVNCSWFVPGTTQPKIKRRAQNDIGN